MTYRLVILGGDHATGIQWIRFDDLDSALAEAAKLPPTKVWQVIDYGKIDKVIASST